MRFVSLSSTVGFAIVASALLLASPALPAQATPELYRRSYALEAAGDYAGALAALEQISAGAAEYVWNLRRGWLLYLAGRYADAVPAYQKAIELQPKAIEPKLGAMLPLMAARRWKEAEKRAAEILALAPGEFTATSRLAYIHYQQGRYAEAEAHYRRALAAYPSSVEMRAGLAWSLLKGAKPKEARVELERILTIAPDHPSAREGLASLP